MRWGAQPVMSVLRKPTRPVAGVSRPEITLNIVVLPAPFGPMMAVMSPRVSARETCDTAVSPPNCIVTSSVARTGLSKLTGRGSDGVRLRDISMGGTAYDRMRRHGWAFEAV